MKYLSLHFLTLFLHVFAYIRAITNDNIAMISSIYHDAILTHTGLELTAEEIDSALQLILQERQQTQTTTTQEPTRSIMECQPRQHIVPQSEIKTKLNRQSTRLRSTHGHYTALVDGDGSSEPSTCLMLHRCHEHGGCCENEHQECTVSQSENVSVDITVQLRNASFIETMEFVNHTECTCQGPTSVQCICPQPFRNVNSKSRAPCDCECIDGREEECRQFQSGQSQLNWEAAALRPLFPTLRHYRICHEESMDGSWRSVLPFLSDNTYCPLLTCHTGLTYNIDTFKCELPLGSPAITTQALPVTEHRTIRDIKLTDYDQVPPHNIQTTPYIANTRLPGNLQVGETTPVIPKKLKNTPRAKLKRKFRRKLKSIQSKGLLESKDSSRIAQKLHARFEEMQREIVQSQQTHNPGDIYINLHKEDASLTCTPVRKAKYYYLHLPDHVLFCNLEFS